MKTNPWISLVYNTLRDSLYQDDFFDTHHHTSILRHKNTEYFVLYPIRQALEERKDDQNTICFHWKVQFYDQWFQLSQLMTMLIDVLNHHIRLQTDSSIHGFQWLNNPLTAKEKRQVLARLSQHSFIIDQSITVEMDLLNQPGSRILLRQIVGDTIGELYVALNLDPITQLMVDFLHSSSP